MSLYIEELEQRTGVLPNGWTASTLGSFFPVKTGKKDANIAVKTGPFPFFTCSQEPAKTDTYSFDGDAILVAGNGNFNVKWYRGKFEAYQRTYVLIPEDGKLLGWLYCAVKRNLDSITQGARGSVIKFITKSNISAYEIATPPDPLHNDAILKLNDYLLCIEANNRESEGLKLVRDTLLPKLMSGEIDVSQVDFMQPNNHLSFMVQCPNSAVEELPFWIFHF